MHGSKIAEKMGITRPSVCAALKNLESDGYLMVDHCHAVYLTEKGRNIAENMHERNTLIQNLLLTLGVDKEIAAKDACEMEHGVSPESFEAFKMLAKK